MFTCRLILALSFFPPYIYIYILYMCINLNCTTLNAMQLFLFIGLEWNRVHYYCGYLLAYCTSPGWQRVVIVGQLVGWMIGSGNRSTQRKPAPVPLCPPQISTWFDPGSNPSRRVGKPGTNRLSYGTASESLYIFIVFRYYTYLEATNWNEPPPQYIFVCNRSN
jgi:hypothetical protein